MPRPANGFSDLVAQEYNRQREAYGRAVAQELGPIARSEVYSDDDELKRWMLADPSVDVLALVQTGMSPADATWKKYPLRRELIVSGKPDIRDQVKYAEKMNAKAEAAMAKFFESQGQADAGVPVAEPVAPVQAGY